MIKAVIFDFDGVLANTYDKTLGICRELFNDVSEELFRDHHNGNVYEKPLLKFNPKDVDYYNREYLRRADAKRFFPIIRQVRQLCQKYKLFIVSSNSEPNIKKYLDLSEADNCFTQVLGMETEKSKCKKFNLIFEKYGIKPSECVFITDTLGDIFEAKKVNVKCIAVTWGYHEKERLMHGNPEIIIDDFSELTPNINQLTDAAQLES